MEQYLVILISSIVTLWLLYYVSYKLFSKWFVFKSYKDVLSVFEVFLDKSYSLTYQNSLVTFMSEGIKNIPSEEKETIERDYIKQTLLLCGPANLDIFYRFFGGKQFAINYILLYIRKRIADDGLAEIVKKTEENK